MQTKTFKLENIPSVKIYLKTHFRLTTWNTVSLKLGMAHNVRYILTVSRITEFSSIPVMVEQLGVFD